MKFNELSVGKRFIFYSSTIRAAKNDPIDVFIRLEDNDDSLINAVNSTHHPIHIHENEEVIELNMP